MKILNMELCTPAIVYLVISVISFIITILHNTPKASYVITSLIWVPLWTALLNWICSKGYTAISWFILLLPVINMFLFVYIVVETLKKH
jgi:uncharacterized membrane protein